MQVEVDARERLAERVQGDPRLEVDDEQEPRRPLDEGVEPEVALRSDDARRRP